MKLAPIVGIVLGVALLGLVFSSAVFTYTATRSFTVTVVNDNQADIALTPNPSNLGTSAGAFVSIQQPNGNLEINFGDVAANAAVIYNGAFTITNNLNQPVEVTITIMPGSSSPSGALQVYANDPPPPPPPAPPAPPQTPPSITFTLDPGVSMPITVLLNTYGINNLGPLSYTLNITATYPAPAGGMGGGGS
ncbi:hypothetical protein [Sulfuracidifex metallicus]|uniref:hypothetical protein n=1 Tax=Sulfuracidifex metallicus TaxID=47303 RepID=UPI002273AB27|nr:hypothetical protein [Sulfuracidifex metallicus]MCY0849749.1 hypothetical protein [Sulfuracidifex metallicus]